MISRGDSPLMNRIFKLANLKSRVTIHYTIQIQQFTIQIPLTLFKFIALFKISGTIQIRNMNSKNPLTRWMNHFRGFLVMHYS